MSFSDFKETSSQESKLDYQFATKAALEFRNNFEASLGFRLHLGMYVVTNIIMLLAATELTFQPLPWLLLWPLTGGIGLFFHYLALRAAIDSIATSGNKANQAEARSANSNWPSVKDYRL